MKKYIFANRYKDKYISERILENLESDLASLEYGDIVEDNFQIWEYPNGKIYKLETDRKVDDKDYYSVSYTKKGIIWLPKLVFLEIDKNKVENAYEAMSKNRKSSKSV